MKKLRLTKSDFNAGSPYSCWLREEMIGEVYNREAGFKDRGLVKKYKLRVTDYLEHIIMNEVRCLDDYPGAMRKIAVDIIRMELDPEFEKGKKK